MAVAIFVSLGQCFCLSLHSGPRFLPSRSVFSPCPPPRVFFFFSKSSYLFLGSDEFERVPQEWSWEVWRSLRYTVHSHTHSHTSSVDDQVWRSAPSILTPPHPSPDLGKKFFEKNRPLIMVCVYGGGRKLNFGHICLTAKLCEIDIRLLGLHMGPNNLCYVTRQFLFCCLCPHVPFYKTLMSLINFYSFIKGHVWLLQLLKWLCRTSLFTHVEPCYW